MSDSISRLDKSLDKLRELVRRKAESGSTDLSDENKRLKQELESLQKKHQTLVETSEDVINELNNSIQVIDNFFKKSDANNKNT